MIDILFFKIWWSHCLTQLTTHEKLGLDRISICFLWDLISHARDHWQWKHFISSAALAVLASNEQHLTMIRLSHKDLRGGQTTMRCTYLDAQSATHWTNPNNSSVQVSPWNRRSPVCGEIKERFLFHLVVWSIWRWTRPSRCAVWIVKRCVTDEPIDRPNNEHL